MRYYLTLDDARTELINSGADDWIITEEDRTTIIGRMFRADLSAGEAIAEYYRAELDDADRRALLDPGGDGD